MPEKWENVFLQRRELSRGKQGSCCQAGDGLRVAALNCMSITKSEPGKWPRAAPLHQNGSLGQTQIGSPSRSHLAGGLNASEQIPLSQGPSRTCVVSATQGLWVSGGSSGSHQWLLLSTPSSPKLPINDNPKLWTYIFSLHSGSRRAPNYLASIGESELRVCVIHGDHMP